MSHTPGPWTVETCGVGYDIMAGGEMLAVIDGRNKGHGRVTADARIIAAAPDLLGAAEMALTCLGYLTQDSKYDNAKALIQAAIKKATGR